MKTATAFVMLALVTPPGFQTRPLDPATTIRVGLARGDSYEVVTLPIETYVARVLAGEAAPGSSPAALEALAITIRTFALANLGRHRADGFELCDETHCQVLRTATAATERAAQATAGQVLLYNGAPAAVYYSASCGGHTELASAVWPGASDPAYLPSQADDACMGEPEWMSEISTADLQRTLAAAGFRGRLRAMKIASRDGSGRVARLEVDGLTPSQISGADLRAAAGRTLGWQAIRSTTFDLHRAGSSYEFDGRGFGHGVGLCVIGSVKLAASGATAPAILRRYFPGAEIGATGIRTTTLTTAPSSVIVSLPDGDEGERDAIVALTAKARDELAKTLGVQAPRVTLRFHPTTTDYERATGQVWFTSGALVQAEVHLVPLASLRDRGVLERTIRRELVHVMADEALARKPAWVRDGAALYFADPSASAPDAGARVVSAGRGAGSSLVHRRPWRCLFPGPKLLCPPDGVWPPVAGCEVDRGTSETTSYNGPMLIKPPADIRSSEITDKKLYLNRRDFIRAATGTAAAAAAGLGVFAGTSALLGAATPAPHGRKLENVMKSPFSTTEKMNSWNDITTYNNYYEFGTDKDRPRGWPIP